MNEKKIFLDMDGTLARFNVPNAIERFKEEVGFFENLKAYVGIERVNELARGGNVYIMSASPNIRADIEKFKWIQRHLPDMPRENIIFCRVGENKAEIIKNKYNIDINSNCILLDDYTKNLEQWEQVGGTGIKRITTASDNSRKLWKGATLKSLRNIAAIAA